MSSLVQAASFVSAAALGVTYLFLRNARRSEGSGGAAPAPGGQQQQQQQPLQAPQAPFLASQDASAVQHLTVPHLSAVFPSAATHPSPLLTRVWPRNLNFVELHEEVVESQLLQRGGGGGGGGGGGSGAPASPALGRSGASVRAFVRAGPVERLYWEPQAARAAIVTCGGLCPGLNTVVREIVLCLHYVYGTREIYGVPHGYGGFYGSEPWLELTPASVSTIHCQGGTVLGSSRGGFDLEKILDALAAKGISQLFVLGGDGTHRGALKLIEGAAARGLKISVIGVPKTIDNDLSLCVRQLRSP